MSNYWRYGTVQIQVYTHKPCISRTLKNKSHFKCDTVEIACVFLLVKGYAHESWLHSNCNTCSQGLFIAGYLQWSIAHHWKLTCHYCQWLVNVCQTTVF